MVERRRGGREARKTLRAAQLAGDERPVQPGMEGGHYRPLTEADVLRIHRAALDVLAEIGMVDAPPSGVATLTAAGARLKSNGQITFPSSLVGCMLAGAGRRFVMHGQGPRHIAPAVDAEIRSRFAVRPPREHMGGP